jgi:hypothetical protein
LQKAAELLDSGHSRAKGVSIIALSDCSSGCVRRISSVGVA